MINSEGKDKRIFQYLLLLSLLMFHLISPKFWQSHLFVPRSHCRQPPRFLLFCKQTHPFNDIQPLFDFSTSLLTPLPFTKLLARTRKTHPIPIRKILLSNLCMSCLLCVSCLSCCCCYTHAKILKIFHVPCFFHVLWHKNGNNGWNEEHFCCFMTIRVFGSSNI